MQQPANQKSISALNQIRVLENICTNSYVSRVDIAKNTGLTSMTITNIVARLINEGIVKDLTDIKGDNNFGRKSILLDIADDSPCVIGINFSRKHIRLVLSDLRAKTIIKKKFEFSEFKDQKDFIQSLIADCKELIQQTNRKIIAIGVSSIGPIDTRTGIIIDPPNFSHLQNIPLVECLQDAFDLPVFAVNDANAAALAEKIYGAAQNEEGFVFFRIETGVGAGIILNGKLYDGLCGMSGEIGHMSINIDGPECSCGNRGCLENYININILTKKINDRHKFDPKLTWEDIVSLHNTNQKLFSDELGDFCKYISFAIENIVNLLDVHTIILEYSGQENGDSLERKIEDEVNKKILAKEKRHVKIIQSSLKSEAAVVGAVSLAISKIFSGEVEYF